jgi:predicted nucleotidyltransferase component of viral defense system
MLKLSEISKHYPDKLKSHQVNILREYLQYKILEIIFNSPYANKLSFLGGTALRILYNNTRFSEDLDFDNFNLEKKEFEDLIDIINKSLNKLGLEVESRNVFKGAWRAYIKIPKILLDNNLSDLANQKIIIQIDTAPHNFNYQVKRNILNKFDVFTQIFSTPVDILLSQKIYTIFNRKRAKGRDFFDVLFLFSFTKPNYDYLKFKLNINTSLKLKKELLKKLKNIDLKILEKDLEPFLFSASEVKKMQLFNQYIKEL